MALATLSIDIVAKLANLEEGMTRATRIAERNAAQMAAAFDKVSATVSGITRVAAPLLGGLTFSGFIISTSKAVDALNDVADATGSSIEKLSGLEEVAQRNGGTLDDVAGILVKFNGALKEADGKNSVSQALQALGQDAEDLRRLDPSEALQRVAVALQGFADDGNKARIVQELFGKSIREAAPFLKDLAEAGELNIRVTKEQAEQAEKFNKNLALLATNASQAGRSLVADLLPALNNYFLIITKLSNGPGIMASLGEVFKGNTFLTAQDSLNFYSSKVKEIDEQITSLRNDKRPLIQAFNGDAIAKLEASREKLQKFADVYRDVVNAGSAGAGRGTGPTPDKPSLPALGGGTRSTASTSSAVTELEKYTKALEAAWQRELNVGEAGKLAFSEIKLRAEGATEAQIQSLRKLANAVDALKNSGRGVYEDPALRRMAVDAQAAADASQRVQDILAKTPTEQARSKQLQMAEVFEAFKNGRLGTVVVDELGNVSEASAEAQQRFVELSAQVLNLGDQTQPAFDRIGEASDKLRKTLDETIGSALYEALGGNFDNIEKAWGNMLKRMLADALATDLRNKIFGENKAGGLGDLLGGFGKLFGGFFADGGNLGAGKWGIAGEAGPEIIHGPANITPMSRAAAGHTFIVNVGQGVTPEQLQLAVTTMGRAVRAQVKGEVFQSIRRDGAFA